MAEEPKRRIVLGAGGTGGHIFPAIAIAEAIKTREPETEVHFIGIGSAIEEKLLSGLDHKHHAIDFVPVVGGGALGFLRFLCNLPGALWSGVRLLREIQASAVLCFGGYPSFIPMLAASVLRLPRALHEQNVKVGLANKFLSLFAKRIFAAKGAAGFWSKTEVEHLANPVRGHLDQVTHWQAPEAEHPWHIFIMGGSQGAVSLNSAILELVPALADLNIHIHHQTGSKDLERVEKAYSEANQKNAEAFAFVDSIEELYASAHLIICRAGAMTAAEVCAVGRPAIYVPLPISGGHQKENVAPVADAGAALIEEHGEDLVARLQTTIRQLFDSPQRLEKMALRARELAKVGEQTSADYLASQLLGLSLGSIRHERRL